MNPQGRDVRVTGPDDVAVTGATLDSRRVRPGDLYAALPGFNVHGADFAGSALEAGAAAILTDPDGVDRIGPASVPIVISDNPRAILGELSASIYGTAGSAPILFGVTGTNGKTTSTYILDALLRDVGYRTGLIGTIETRIAGKAVASARTTPESPDLHRLLAEMRASGVSACSMEVSSHALALHRVDGARFDVVGFTNLSQDHLDFHDTMEDYFQAKALLFDPVRAGRGAIVVDDAWGARLARETTLPVVTISSTPRPGGDVDYWIEEVDGPRFTLVHRGGERMRTSSPIAGDFNVTNTALALVMLLEGGVSRTTLAELTPQVAVPGRMEIVSDANPRVVVDFAHTPESIARALGALRAEQESLGSDGSRLIAVFGAGGDRDRAKRRDMGKSAVLGADVAIITDDNPRSEDPAAIRAEIRAGADDALAQHPGTQIIEVAGRKSAIARAVGLAGARDVVLVAGKGHEPGQQIGDTVHPFDDREEVRRALAALPGTDRPDR
nr:UDP-N-acetylmuramoyl-L-alanyl-D-glutamate--2,6-diaminopimelate ligase [Spelaeicoccus albus]